MLCNLSKAVVILLYLTSDVCSLILVLNFLVAIPIKYFIVQSHLVKCISYTPDYFKFYTFMFHFFLLHMLLINLLIMLSLYSLYLAISYIFFISLVICSRENLSKISKCRNFLEKRCIDIMIHIALIDYGFSICSMFYPILRL